VLTAWTAEQYALEQNGSRPLEGVLSIRNDTCQCDRDRISIFVSLEFVSSTGSGCGPANAGTVMGDGSKYLPNL